MKSCHQNLFLRSASLLSLCTFVVFSAAHAATIDTTGTTIVLNVDAPEDTFIGNGTLQVSTDGVDGNIFLGTGPGNVQSVFAMTSGGSITIDSGVTFVNGGWSKGLWTNNKADMQVNGTLNLWDGNVVLVDALTGAGSVIPSTSQGTGNRDLRVGVDGGAGTFSGSIGAGDATRWVRIFKDGSGTQTFDNLANQKPRSFVLNAGLVDLSAATDVTLASGFSGVGNLAKNGAGVLTLSGALTHTGTTTVSAGTLSFGTNFSGSSPLLVASGAKLNLNFAGNLTVGSLDLGGSGPLPAGIYNSSHPTYGSFFTGTGALKILGAVPPNSGTWTSLSNGNWSDNPNWQGNIIASGSGNAATFNAATGVTVTLDANFTIGQLSFATSDYTISGLNTLTLAGTTPGVTVANGRTATISSVIAGTEGLAKLDAGVLTLSGANTYTGGTTVSAGRLKLVNNKTGSSSFVNNSELEFNLSSGDRVLNGGSISGSGNLIKSGGSQLILGANLSGQTVALTGTTTIIDVQGGTLRNDFGNSAWGSNRAGLAVASLATFDIWDGNATVDELNGSGTINKGNSFGAGASTTLTIGVNSGSGTFGGVITNTAGTLNLAKQGSGTQTLTNANTFSGSTTISAGILSLGNSLAMQNSTLNTANSIVGDATNGLRTTAGAALTLGGLSGNKDLASVFTTSSGGYNTLTALTLNLGTGLNRSYSGIIGDGAPGMTLTKTGLGVLSLSGANTYTGATAVNAGILGFRKSSTSSITVAANAGLGLVLGGAGNYTLSDLDSLWANTLPGVTLDATSLVGIDTSDGDSTYASAPASTRGFAKLGPNTLTLTGNNALTFSGGVTVYAGVLSFANTDAKPGTGTVTVNAGAGLALGVGGAGFYSAANVDSLWTNTLPGVTMSAFALVGIDTTQGDLTYTTAPSSTRGLAKVGTNILTLTGANAYTGTTLVGAGRLKLVDTTTGSGVFVTNAELEFNVASLPTTGQRLSANRTVNGTGNLIKTGGGTLFLGLFDGPGNIGLTGSSAIFDIQEGTIAQDWGNTNAWVNNRAGMNIASGATFNIANGNAIVDELTGSGTITKSQGGGVTLTLGVNNGSGTFSGPISNGAGGMALLKQGTGAQTLSGVVGYNGGTTVNGGRLTLVDTTTGSSAFVTNAELEFNITTGNKQISNGSIGGSGNLIKTGAGQLWLGGNLLPQTVAFTGANSIIDVQAGTLRNEFGNGTSAPAVWGNNKAGLTVAGGATFDVWDGIATVDELNGSGTIQKGFAGTSTLTIGANDGSGNFSGSIANPLGTLLLDKQGSGTQTLSGSNTYAGATTINNGTLILTGATQATTAITSAGAGKLGLDIGSPVTAASATVTFTGSTVLVTGTPTLASYTLLTANSIIGTPTLAAPAPVGYSLSVVGNELRLVSSGDPFLSWAGNDPGVLFDGDANNDGVDNGTAWFLGALDKDANANGLLPKPTQNAGALVLEFDCLDTAARGTSIFEVQYSSDLGQIDMWQGTVVPGSVGSFTDGVVDFEVTDPAPPGGLLKVVATVPVGEAAAGKVFGRIKGSK